MLITEIGSLSYNFVLSQVPVLSFFVLMWSDLSSFSAPHLTCLKKRDFCFYTSPILHFVNYLLKI